MDTFLDLANFVHRNKHVQVHSDAPIIIIIGIAGSQ